MSRREPSPISVGLSGIRLGLFRRQREKAPGLDALDFDGLAPETNCPLQELVRLVDGNKIRLADELGEVMAPPRAQLPLPKAPPLEEKCRGQRSQRRH